MKFYSQTDPLWGQDKLGQSSCTIARWGCTISSVCMILSKYFSQMTPKQAARLFKFTPDGLLIWQSDFSPAKFVKRGFGSDEKELREWLKDSHNTAIINVKNKYIPSHWVAADRYSIIGLNAVDPLGGVPIRVKAKYQILGYALFTNKK